MTVVKRVSMAEMLLETGMPALGYSQPDKDRILLRKGLPKKKEREVLGHEYEHIAKGEEGPWVQFIPMAISAGSALLNAKGAKDASKASAESSEAAIAEQRRQFDTVMGLNQNAMNTGNAARNQLASILGLSVPNDPYTPLGGYGSSGGGSSKSKTDMFGVPNRWSPLAKGSIFNDALKGGVTGFVTGAGPLGGMGLNKVFGHKKTKNRPYAQKDVDSFIQSAHTYRDQYDTPEEVEAYAAKQRPGARDQIRQALYNNGFGQPSEQAQSAEQQQAGPMSNTDIMSRLEQYPGFQFAVEQARKSSGAQASAMGSSPLSGNVLTALQTDISGRIAMPAFSDYMNRLSSLSGGGQVASSDSSSAAMNTGANVGTLLQNQGDARASGILGQSQALQDLLAAFGKIGGRKAGGT